MGRSDQRLCTYVELISRRERVTLSLLTVPLTLAAQTRPLVITNVTIIDGTGSPGQPAMSVVIREGRIETIDKTGHVAVLRGAEVVNGAGKYLTPGLGHAHTSLLMSR
jgi:imidazolonepropionase-like amidohydrolase